jgi:murein DD-endopeptidase MepM/ murein hydrolase activator NlpD
LYAPSTVNFTVTSSKNVGYLHWSYIDSYSPPEHNSASGDNITRVHSHTYSHQGTFKAVLYAYTSFDTFKTKQPCDSKTVTVIVRQQPAVAIKNGWQWPTEGKVISGVGMRVQPVTGQYRMHQGIDIQNVKGTRINAARDGHVVATNSACHSSASNCGGGYGNYVVIRHSDGLYSIYAHLSKVDAHVGEIVSGGQKIGEMGNTGLTYTVHLHFGIGPTIWVNYNVLNPLKVLPPRH